MEIDHEMISAAFLSLLQLSVTGKSLCTKEALTFPVAVRIGENQFDMILIVFSRLKTQETYSAAMISGWIGCLKFSFIVVTLVFPENGS